MAPALPVLVLQFVRGKYHGQEYPLEQGKSVIAGRSTEADLVLADDAVSRKHARFYGARGRIWVRDLGSRNGTVVNGERVELHCLRAGDRVVIGSSLARVDHKPTADVNPRRAGEQRRRRPNDSAGRSMTGSIEDIPLMDVLQWLATSRKTGCLKVRDVTRNRVGALHLREGRVYYAAIEGNRG
ncbi:MAG TPA: FHA domain-containing protein, partial [Nannocystaceae bacterium]|nr:FHA domain-containing protein [Nannocystaceae bacterium]